MDTSHSDLEYYDRAFYTDEVRCFVPSCHKSRRDYPNTTFLSIPKSLKDIWCTAVKRNCPKRTLHVCEEHINIEQDCYKSKRGKLHLKQTANLELSRSYYEKTVPNAKKKQKTMGSNMARETVTGVLPTSSTQLLQFDNSPFSKCDSAIQCQTDVMHKAVMVKPSARSVCCGTNIQATDLAEKLMPSKPQQDIMLSSSTTTSGASTPSIYEPSHSSGTTSSFQENTAERKDLSGRYHILNLIKQNPKMYIGIPTQYYWLVDFLAKQCKLRSLHILISLFKIKQNDTLKRIGDHFNLSKFTVQEILRVCLPHLASYLQNFIYLPSAIDIKKTLPPVFKCRYANVQCLIDCFEIEIEKPSDPLIQARTWSQYKSCNTVKYLIACCPNGFICFISKGYGGRISDKAITELSGFVDILPAGAVVLADRGFKGIESLLRERHLKLLRPPSVSAKEKPTKKEVIQSKVIASLRIHVERVIRRVREFRLLKPHGVINHYHISYIDECVIIACALANLQGNIIKIQ